MRYAENICFRRSTAIALRHIYLMRGSLARLLPVLILPAVDIVLWGYITKYFNALTDSRFSLAGSLLAAVVLWDFLVRVMQGVTTAFFEDVWTHNFLHVFSTPITISEYTAGLVLCSIATSVVGVLVMILLATTLFRLSLCAYGLMLLPFVLILFIFGIALGILGTAVVLRFGPSAEWLVWPIPAIISPFVGVFYPLSTLPSWIRHVSRLLPPSYAFEGMRAILSGAPVSVFGLIWGFCLSALALLLACRFLVYVYHDALRTGIIVRYSAETLS